MNIKTTVAGIIVTMTMVAVGPSQAARVTCASCATCSTSACPTWTVPAQFSGTGWGVVPCNTYLRHAVTWQEYASGHYAPPEF